MNMENTDQLLQEAVHLLREIKDTLKPQAELSRFNIGQINQQIAQQKEQEEADKPKLKKT